MTCCVLQMIGNDALPGLSYSKTNSYNGKSRSLPVFPSDHFGLFLRLEPCEDEDERSESF